MKKISIDSLLSKLPLEDKEKKILKLVFLISLVICVLTVASIWTIQYLKNHKAQLADEPEIIEEIELNLNLDSLDIVAHKIAINQFLKINQPYNAVKHLRRIIAIQPKCRKERLELATAYLKSALYNKALVIFKNLTKENKIDSLTESIDARYALALFHYGIQIHNTDTIDAGVSMLDKTINKFPKSAEAYCYRGQIEASLNKNSPKVIKLLQKSTELDSLYAEPLYQLARYYMKKSNITRIDLLNARMYLQKTLAISPLYSKAHARLGMVYYYLKQPNLAKKEYEIAIALNPEDYNTYYNLGELYNTSFKNPVKALEAYKKTLELDSLNARANFKAGLVALEKSDMHSQANYKAGLITLDNNMLNESIRFFINAHKSAPRNIRILFQLAVAYEKKKMFENAKDTYSEVLKIDPLNAIAIQKLKLLNNMHN